MHSTYNYKCISEVAHIINQNKKLIRPKNFRGVYSIGILMDCFYSIDFNGLYLILICADSW